MKSYQDWFVELKDYNLRHRESKHFFQNQTFWNVKSG